ncbi:hypothetical protein Dimus_001921 [Dionaea muscipula]
MTPNVFLLSVLLLLSATVPPHSLVAAKCNAHDKKVLLQIKADLGNPYALASWLPDADCCTDWYAVTCNADDRINGILVQYDSNLSSTIPAAVGDLPFLELIFFHKLPHLVGNIPESITKLKHLSQIRITWNNLTGSVPGFLSKIKSLTEIELSFNNLSGSIPPSLSSLPSLTFLALDRNKLTGSIPDSFGSLASGFYLELSHNQLTGPVPGSLGKVNFTSIDLSRNRLTGDALFLFGSNKPLLEHIDLSRNNFSFDFSNAEFTVNLQYIDLDHNKITGSLPEGLVQLTELQYINVSYNRLCGQIPQGGNLQNFGEYNYLHNKCLCGNPLPACK